jgi:hypothetical protein
LRAAQAHVVNNANWHHLKPGEIWFWRLRRLLADTGDRGMVPAVDTADAQLLQAGGAFRRSRTGQSDKATRLFRLAHGAARCGIARVLRGRAPHDVGASSTRTTDARGLEKAACVVPIYNILRAAHRHAVAPAHLSMSYLLPRLRPERFGAGNAAHSCRGALSFTN